MNRNTKTDIEIKLERRDRDGNLIETIILKDDGTEETV